MSTVRPDAEGYDFSVQMFRKIWNILSSFAKVGKTTKLGKTSRL